MGIIKLLPDAVINTISAGEVVERPASVVRELVDNSLDAGATEISVYLENGGHTLIKISDNGAGMSREDAILAFERHATSKLRTADDLIAIQTLGFRGEALPSIAAVSRVVMRTRHTGSPIGSEIRMSGGTITSVKEGPAPLGTDFEVSDLFYNTPARRKFLRQPKTEEQRVRSWILNVSLGHPLVRFRLFLDGRESLTLAPRGSFIERAKSLLSGSLVEVSHTTGRIAVTGVVGHPSAARADLSALVTLVNGRVITDKAILRAVKEGFDSTLKDREIPLGAICLIIPPEDVDVNVHPQKSEVRFRNSQEIFVAVRSAVLKAVRTFTTPVNSGMPLPQPTLPAGSFQSALFGGPSPSATVTWGPKIQPSFSYDGGAAVAPAYGELSVQEEVPFRFSDLQPIGQAFACYIFCENGDSLYVIDMHAAHERYNFNLIRNALVDRPISSQVLLVPETVKLSQEETHNLLSRKETLQRLGIAMEQFGPDTVLIRSIPTILKGKALVPLMKEIAQIPAEEPGIGAENVLREKMDHIAARMACHASVRSGFIMASEEIRALFASLDSTEFSAACPHGRPVIVSFTKGEVERWFGRDR